MSALLPELRALPPGGAEPADLQSPIAPAEELLRWVRQCRALTLSLLADLSEEQLQGERHRLVNPKLWHLGHIGWFQEKWALRELEGAAPLHPGVDGWFDSFAVPHETRWDLDMPNRQGCMSYAAEVLERVLERIGSLEPEARHTYFNRLTVFHEYMHDEAMLHHRQLSGYPLPPRLAQASREGPLVGASLAEDVEIPGCEGFLLGGGAEDPFLFDNEKWAHPVRVAPFAIARAPVTNGEFAQFIEAGGYENPACWSSKGWLWLGKRKAGGRGGHPIYWRRSPGGGWQVRFFDTVLPLAEHHPAMCISWYEAEAYCLWRGRRLPTEAEWELAAASEPVSQGGSIGRDKRRFPWGNELPQPELAHMSTTSAHTLPVDALAAGESAHGCRQMLGNVWEWTADPFFPYPGFELDPYREYSAPWFGNHKVLKGGGWASWGALLRNSWRNFAMPGRCDIFSGFRTCAL